VIKTVLKKITNPSMRRKIKAIFGYKMLDEVEIVYQIFKGKREDRVMIDVGACVGACLENFAKMKWEIYAFEPDPGNYNILQNFCKKFSNVIVEKQAVSDQDKKDCPFYTSEISAGISSLKPFHDTHKASYIVDTLTLKSYCSEKNIRQIDFLKIDAEGYDFLVLKGLDWTRYKPEVIICEFEDKKSIPLGYTFKEMADFLCEKGYKMLVSEWYPIVEYGQRHKWRRFVEYPCQLEDAKAFGNIIAVSNDELFAKLSTVTHKYGNRS